MGSLRSRASTTLFRRVSRASVDVRRWPHDPTIAHAVLLDVSTPPSLGEIEQLTEQVFVDDADVQTIRTSALFPGHRDRFANAGYEVCDTLALLERPIDRIEPIGTDVPDGVRLRRLTATRLHDAERIDIAAFPSGWANTATTLADIALATPRHRARLALAGADAAGFAITGVAGPIGYLQRLAVDPDHQRRGIAHALVRDSLGWLQRRGATTVLVNTGVGNEAALDLYRAHRFRRRDDDLVIMERRR